MEIDKKRIAAIISTISVIVIAVCEIIVPALN